MNSEQFSLIAGAVSSLMFVSSQVPMLWKAYKTRDLSSYSYLNIILVNVGNLIYWFYVVSLPPGPIWLLHTFYTLSSGLLLILYWRWHPGKCARYRVGRRIWDGLERRIRHR
jgi:hypothetical protein